VEVSIVRKALLRNYRPEDEIAVAWWDRDWFQDLLGRTLSDEEWEVVIDAAEGVLEFTNLGDSMIDAAENALSELTKKGKRK